MCQGENIFGKPCGASPVTAGRVVSGITCSGDYCMAHEPALHSENAPGGHGFGGTSPKGGRPRLPKKTEVAMQMIEDAAAELIAEQLQIAVMGEKAVVVGNGAHAEIEMSPDLRARLAASDSLLDRLMGRARQTTEIIGAPATADELRRIQPTPDRARKVADILAQAGAVKTPHTTGRRRAKPSQPAKSPEETKP